MRLQPSVETSDGITITYAMWNDMRKSSHPSETCSDAPINHPRFGSLGDDYPFHLEKHYDRILTKIDESWGKPEVLDYFIRELETFREAIIELSRRGIGLRKEHFFRALNDGNQELIDLFVRSRFNIQILDEDGNPPLMVALKKGYSVIAKILLDAGADVNARDKLGLTPLLVACGKSSEGYKAIAELLIKKGAFINVRDTLGFTPFLLSLSGGTTEIAKLLVERGADVSACTKKGEAALNLASRANNVEITRSVTEWHGGSRLTEEAAAGSKGSV